MAILLGLFLAGAGAANQFYLEEPMYHPLAGYVLIIPGIALVLRALRPPIGFMRVVSTLLGGASIGACPLFLVKNSASPPWISILLVFLGAALLGASFTARTRMHRRH
ncbi:hypothetical protein [Pontiella desulfatans]|nr:hypothetical protein [Pontiella desulfatans]